MEIIVVFIEVTLIVKVIFIQLSLYNRLNITGNKVSPFQTIIDITGEYSAIALMWYVCNNKAVLLYCISIIIIIIVFPTVSILIDLL